MTDTENLEYLFKIYTELGENAKVHLPLGTALDIFNEIKERDAMIARLEKEADWLAVTLHLKGCVPEGTVIDWTNDGVRKAWREKARKAVGG